MCFWISLSLRIVVAVIPIAVLLAASVFTVSRFRTSAVVVSEYTPLLLNDNSSDTQEKEVDQTRGLCSVALAVPLKLLLLALILLVTVLQFILSLAMHYPLYTTISSILLILAWSAVLILAYQEFRKKFKTTVLLLIFLVISLLANAVKIRTVVRESQLDRLWDSLFFVSFGLQALALFALLLSPPVDQNFDEERGGTRSEAKANFVLKLTYWWITPLFRLAKRKVLDIKDLSGLSSRDSSQQISTSFEEIHDELVAANKYTLARALFILIGRTFWKQAVCLLISTLFSFVGPICLVRPSPPLSFPGLHISAFFRLISRFSLSFSLFPRTVSNRRLY